MYYLVGIQPTITFQSPENLMRIMYHSNMFFIYY